MFISNLSISLLSGIITLLLLFFILNLSVRKLTKNKDKLVNYLKKALKKDEYKEQWEKYRYDQWFKVSDERFDKEKTFRKRKAYPFILLISLLVFFIIKLFGNLSIKEELSSLPIALIPLPIVSLILFFLISLGPVFGGLDKNKANMGTIISKINISVYIIFPWIKKSLIVFTHEPIPDYYGDPRIVESLYYLKNVRKIKTIKIYCYFPHHAPEEKKLSIKEKIIKKYKEKGLFDILHFLGKKENFQHFMVGDNSVVRIEKKHTPWIKSSPEEYNFPNKTYLFNPILALELKSFLKSI